jgi:AcrR family transcriptional regulator
LKNVQSSIKDQQLVEKRRKQMIKGAVSLFKEKGFHRTTTREIAKAAGFSIGTLYEYIRTKEDVLFLVCDSIYEHVKERMEKVVRTDRQSLENLKEAVKSYYYLVDEMQDEVIVLYQEVKSLAKDAQEYILQKEKEMVRMLEEVIKNSIPYQLSEKDVRLIANNIFVQGQMWSFRRWILQKEFSIEEYSEKQLNYLLRSLNLTN